MLKMLRQLAPIALVFQFTAACQGQPVKEPSKVPAEWTNSYRPFRIAGNLYYVGTYDLACYLVVTPAGNILINTGISSSAPMIRANIESLGFTFSDIKILLTTQAHYDHVGAMAEIKESTKAKFYVNRREADVVADGGSSDYELGGNGSTFKPVKADRLLDDGDSISLGGTSLVMLHHPGHTKGSCSYLVDVKDGNRSYRVLIANMPTIISERKFSAIDAYPSIATDFATTLQAMKKIDFDLWVASHASQFDLHKKRQPGDAYNPEIFADRKNYNASLEKLLEAYNRKLAEE